MENGGVLASSLARHVHARQDLPETYNIAVGTCVTCCVSQKMTTRAARLAPTLFSSALRSRRLGKAYNHHGGGAAQTVDSVVSGISLQTLRRATGLDAGTSFGNGAECCCMRRRRRASAWLIGDSMPARAS